MSNKKENEKEKEKDIEFDNESSSEERDTEDTRSVPHEVLEALELINTFTGLEVLIGFHEITGDISEILCATTYDDLQDIIHGSYVVSEDSAMLEFEETEDTNIH